MEINGFTNTNHMVCMYVCLCTFVCTYVCMCVCVCVCIYVCMCVCVSVCMYMYMYICTYMYMYLVIIYLHVYTCVHVGMLSATASLGLILLWDVEGGLTEIDKFLYSGEDFIKVLLNRCIRYMYLLIKWSYYVFVIIIQVYVVNI